MKNETTPKRLSCREMVKLLRTDGCDVTKGCAGRGGGGRFKKCFCIEQLTLKLCQRTNLSFLIPILSTGTLSKKRDSALAAVYIKNIYDGIFNCTKVIRKLYDHMCVMI